MAHSQESSKLPHKSINVENRPKAEAGKVHRDLYDLFAQEKKLFEDLSEKIREKVKCPPARTATYKSRLNVSSSAFAYSGTCSSGTQRALLKPTRPAARSTSKATLSLRC